MHYPLVSIIVPYKNTANYLPECLDSILEQSYANFELIIVNDHSTDSSKAIVESYAKKDSRIFSYNTNGQGIIDALQFAYSKSKGTYVTRMDSDDIMVPNKLELMVTALQNTGNGHIALGQVSYFSKEGISNGYYTYEKWLNKLTRIGTNFSEIYKECVIPSPCWMVSRVDFDLCGGFNSDIYPEDYDLAFRFYQKKLKCIPCDQVLHMWRDYDDRTSRTSEHYAENYFLDLKMSYFLKIDYHTDRNLVVWGAGKKGKQIAQKLIDQNISFNWICNNKKKIGKHIYGIEMQQFLLLNTLPNPQIIVTVANKNEQRFIRAFLQKLAFKAAEDYFFFC